MQFLARSFLVRVSMTLCLGLGAHAAHADCPAVAAPLQCRSVNLPGPTASDKVEIAYVHPPVPPSKCGSCIVLDLYVENWRGSVANARVLKMFPVPELPKEYTLADPVVADAVVAMLGYPPRLHEELTIAVTSSTWTLPVAREFFRTRGWDMAVIDSIVNSPPVRLLVQSRHAMTQAVGTQALPYAVVANRHVLAFTGEPKGSTPMEFTFALGRMIETSVASTPTPAIAPAATSGSPAAGIGAPVQPIGTMPTPADFLPAPPNAASTPARKCSSGAIRTQPADLVRKDDTARRAQSQLRLWGAKHFRFDGARGCTDWDFVIAQWQTMVGLPQTSVLGAAEVTSVQDALTKAAPQLRAAQEKWSNDRAAAIGADVDPDTGKPFTPGQLERRRRGELARSGHLSPEPPGPQPPFVRPAPVGPPEMQVLGLSLGAEMAPQLPLCRWTGSPIQPLDFSRTCYHRLPRIGRSTANWMIDLEAELFSENFRTREETIPERTGLVAISFAPEERPGLLARAGIRGLLVDGRLEGIGFVPSDKQAVLDAFKAKYRSAFPPVPVGMSNERGAKWTGYRYFSVGAGVSAWLNCVGFSTESCSFAEVITSRGSEALKNWRAKDADAGTKF